MPKLPEIPRLPDLPNPPEDFGWSNQDFYENDAFYESELIDETISPDEIRFDAYYEKPAIPRALRNHPVEEEDFLTGVLRMAPDIHDVDFPEFDEDELPGLPEIEQPDPIESFYEFEEPVPFQEARTYEVQDFVSLSPQQNAPAKKSSRFSRKKTQFGEGITPPAAVNEQNRRAFLQNEENKEYVRTLNLWRVVFFIFLILLIFEAIFWIYYFFLSPSDGNTASQPASEETEVLEETLDLENPAEYTDLSMAQTISGIGSTSDVNGVNYSLVDVQYLESSSLYTPASGNELIICTIGLENNSGFSVSYNPYNYSLTDANGNALSPITALIDGLDAFEQGTLENGQNYQGQLVFEVPLSSSNLVLNIYETYREDPVASFVFAQSRLSPYLAEDEAPDGLEANPAFGKAGFDQLNEQQTGTNQISYSLLSAQFLDTSVNGLQPSQDRQFVVCMIRVQNLADFAQTIFTSSICIFDESGNVYFENPLVSAAYSPIFSGGDMEAGAGMEGYIAFEVPTSGNLALNFYDTASLEDLEASFLLER